MTYTPTMYPTFLWHAMDIYGYLKQSMDSLNTQKSKAPQILMITYGALRCLPLASPRGFVQICNIVYLQGQLGYRKILYPTCYPPGKILSSSTLVPAGRIIYPAFRGPDFRKGGGGSWSSFSLTCSSKFWRQSSRPLLLVA